MNSLARNPHAYVNGCVPYVTVGHSRIIMCNKKDSIIQTKMQDDLTRKRLEREEEGEKEAKVRTRCEAVDLR